MVSMKRVKCLTIQLFSALVALSFISGLSVAAQEKTNLKANQAAVSNISVRGKVFCLDESGHRLSENQDCNKGTHGYEIVAADKKIYRFSPDDVLTSMFKEPTVRKLEVQINGVLHDKNLLEIASLHAVRDGRLYDIFYYCEICSITAYGPGDCACCYNPLEFREKPVLDN